MKTWLSGVAAALLVATLYLVGCGSDSSQPTTPTAGADAVGVRVYEPDEIEAKVNEARFRPEFLSLEQAMARNQFLARFDLAVGGEASAELTGTVAGAVLLIPFEKQGAPAVGAVIRIVSMDGKEPKLSAAAFRSVGHDLVAEGVDLGQGLELQGTWWSNFWRCLLQGCGGGAIGCLWGGPVWWHCAVAVCGGTAIICAITS